MPIRITNKPTLNGRTKSPLGDLGVNMMQKELPKGWVEVNIGEIYSFLGGGTPSKSKQEYWNGSIPWASIKDISKVDTLRETIDFITQSGLDNSSANLAVKGEIIIGTRMTIGKPVITLIQTAINQDLKIVRGNLPNKFTFYWFKALNDILAAQSSGTTVKGIRLEVLNKTNIPLPPLPTQHRIVSKLDTLFGHLDALKTRLDRIPQLLKAFRQSVLTQAVTGKLTEEWREGREFEEFTVLVKKIFDERKRKYEKELLSSIKLIGNKPKKPSNLDTKIVPLDEIATSWDLPKEWGIMPLVFCTSNSPDSIVDGPFGSSINVNEDYIETGIPVVRMVNIRPFKYINDNLKYVKIEKFISLKRHNILPKDVLIAKVGATIGDCCVYPDNFPEAMLSTTGSCRIRVDLDFFDFKFIELYICHQKNVLRSIASQTAQPFLNMQVLKSFPVIVMHKHEQQEIVRRVESLFAKADRIEAQYQTLKAKIEQLPQALLAKAFSGELVGQLPGDGDARELLEALRQAQRPNAKKMKGEREKGKVNKQRILRGAQDATELKQVAEPQEKYGKMRK